MAVARLTMHGRQGKVAQQRLKAYARRHPDTLHIKDADVP